MKIDKQAILSAGLGALVALAIHQLFLGSVLAKGKAKLAARKAAGGA